jgi:hypothetical protein
MAISAANDRKRDTDFIVYLKKVLKDTVDNNFVVISRGAEIPEVLSEVEKPENTVCTKDMLNRKVWRLQIRQMITSSIERYYKGFAKNAVNRQWTARLIYMLNWRGSW